MGAKHSKGTIRSELQGVLPRSWAELELFHTRFQQEVFRRKAADAQCQFFLTFQVFRSVVLLRVKAAPSESEEEEWRVKERLLRAFQYLDRKGRHRVAAIDFFAGLALVTNAKKAAKFDFLFSLFDNGGLKVLNSCEVMMIVAAAARGLAMFKAISAADEESLRPLGRRLMGDTTEVTLAHLVEKALTDPEIVFFMNDLENETATTSDALLAQQGRLMKSIAANELQLHRIEGASRTESNVHMHPETPALITSKPLHTHRPSTEAMLRRLQAILLPPARQAVAGGGSDAPRVVQNIARRLDARSLCRLAQSISDGALHLTKAEAESMLSSVNSDELGSVRCSDILRVMRSWLAHASIISPPLWQTLAIAAQKQLRNFETTWLRSMATLSGKTIARSVKLALNGALSGTGAELSYTFKAHIAHVAAATLPQGNPLSTTSEPQIQPTKESAVRIRLRVHHNQSESSGAGEIDEPETNDDEDMVLIVELGLRSGLSDEDAIDVASAVEQFLNDEHVLSHVQFALGSCQATVVESQARMSSQSKEEEVMRCLRLSFLFKWNVFEDFEHVTRCQLSQLVRSGFFSLEFDQSLDELVSAAQSVVSLFPHLMKHEDREKLLSAVFRQFDTDKDGRWSLQEFNAFQQASRECVLDDQALFQCFGGKRELTVADLIKAFQMCSADEFRALIEKLGRGSLAHELTGVLTGTVALDEHEFKQLEQSFSPLHWGDHLFKRLSFFVRSMADFSCDFHCQNIVELMQAVGVPHAWCTFMESPTTFVKWFNMMRDFVSPAHKEHERDFVCRSLLCSMEDVVTKTPQQLELEDQQQGLPQGTSARRAATLLKAHKAMTLLRENVSSLERLAITSPQICISASQDKGRDMDVTITPPPALTVFKHDETEARIGVARRHRHGGKLSEALQAFEEALELEGDSDVIWGEIALTQYQIWHQFVSQLHKPSVLQSPHAKASDDDTSGTRAPFGATILREAYNSFIVAMEYAANKKNPALLIKMAVLYLEFQSYRGALSVCTLLVEGYSHSSVLHEAIFLCAVSAKAVRKHRESAQYFQYLVEKPPFRLAAYQLHLLAALELEQVDGMRDHMRETYAQAYSTMIKLSPITESEKTAHQVYKTSHKNENQRVQMWFLDDRTWFDLASKLASLNFPLLVCDVLAVVRKRGHAIPKEILQMEGVSAYRVGDGRRAVQALQEALEMEYWSDHTRFLMRTTSEEWRSQFALEVASTIRIQQTVWRHWLRKNWRVLARNVMEEKRREAATTIQCAWRQVLARQQLAERRRERRERERCENERMATEDWFLILKQLNKAASTIQSLHKIFCARREARFRRSVQTKHSRILEAFAIHRSASGKKTIIHIWRRFVEQQKQERVEAACIVQRQARCHLSRKIYKRLLDAKARQERIVLLCLDRRTASVQRRTMQEWLAFLTLRRELKSQAARRIQHVWRCHQGRKRYRYELRRHLLANELMHRMLADKTAQMMRATWNALSSNAIWHRMRKYRSAVTIQRHARGLIARRYVRRLRSRRRRVAIVVNAMRERSAKQLVRVVFNGFVRFIEMQWELREAGATALQRIFRGYAARKRVRFLRECNRILQEPGMTLRNKPDAYVLRVCFLLLARLPEQNRMDKYYAGVKVQKWYRRARKRRQLVTALNKLHRQRAILNTLQVNFKRMALLFFQELKQRVLAKRWRRDRMARRIQRTAKKWLTYRRYCRELTKRELRKGKAAQHARKKQLVLLSRCLFEWHRVVRQDHKTQVDAVLRIQRAYRTRLAKKAAQRELYKRAKRARLMESIHLKPLERCFRQWEERMIERSVLTVRAAAKTNGGAVSPDKWRAAMKTAPASPQRSYVPVATLEQRAELPSLLFYTLLNRVRQSGILQLSFASGLSGLTTPQLQQLLSFASSVIVDGGGNAGGPATTACHLVEHVVEAMASSARPCPAQKLIFYNASLSAAHAASLHSILRHPDSAATSLVLSNIQLTTSAVVSIAASLCLGHSKLEQLVLEACAIGSAGAAAIAEALCHTRQLWKLDLSHNHIGDSACPALAQGLVANASLRVLSLSGNAISDRGVLSYLAPVLERAAMGLRETEMGSNGGAASATSSSASRLESVVLRAMPRISPLGRVALQQATTRFPVAVHLD